MSKPYIISYDLDNPGQRYDEIIKIITEKISTGAWCHYLDSTYLLRSELTPSQMVEKLKPSLDNNDRMFISEIHPDNYGGWMDSEQWSYIKESIFGLQ